MLLSLSVSGTIADGTLSCLTRSHHIPSRQDLMSAKNREIAESAFEKYQRREAEIASALRQEQVRHDAVIKNMHRLRSLRLQQEAQGPPAKGKPLHTKSSATKASPARSSEARSSQASQARSRQTA